MSRALWDSGATERERRGDKGGGGVYMWRRCRGIVRAGAREVWMDRRNSIRTNRRAGIGENELGLDRV